MCEIERYKSQQYRELLNPEQLKALEEHLEQLKTEQEKTIH
jgi:hypothetical protein